MPIDGSRNSSGPVAKHQKLQTLTVEQLKKRPVGRPRKKRNVQATSVDLTSRYSPQIGEDHAKPSASHSRHVKNPTQESSSTSTNQRRLQVMFSHGQKQNVALYTWHHGARVAGRRFGVHKKIAGRWMKEEVEMWNPTPHKRKH